MNKEQELRRCPFCNATPHKGATKVQHDQLHGGPFQRYRIWCPHGCANIERVNKEQAREAWNGSDLPDDKAAWQWSDSSGKWYTVDTAFATLEEQEELARRVAGQHEGRVRPLFARRSSDEQAEVVPAYWYGEKSGVLITHDQKLTWDAKGYGTGMLVPLYASPPAVAAGGVTEEMVEAAARAIYAIEPYGSSIIGDVDWDEIDRYPQAELLRERAIACAREALTAALGLVERLRQSAELFEAVRAMHAGAECADAEPHWSSQAEAETAHDLASEAAAAIERLVAERDEAFEISAKIADACRTDIERNPHDFGPLDQGGIRASEKIAAAIRARQALKDAP